MAEQPSTELIATPQGGGALKGLGDTFQPDLHTGTGSYRVPIEVPPGRGGLQPALALTYNSGFSNGPFGFGWALDAPRITRRTNRRVPRYTDDDVFVLSGAEELVPVPGGEPGVQRFRPRAEGLFARIERHTGGGQDHWLVWARDGTRTRYGTVRPAHAGPEWTDSWTIARPGAPRDVFGWLPSETVDTAGNVMRHEYRDEDGSANRYLKAIRYVDHGDPKDPDWLVEVRLTYGSRPDVMTDRAAGFPLRTGLRCTSIEVWVDAGTPVRTRSIALEYADAADSTPANGVSLLGRIVVTGHAGGGEQAMAPLTFEYSRWEPQRRRWMNITSAGGGLPSPSLAGGGVDLVDLFGDGLPCIVEMAESSRYWRNRGGGRFDRARSMPFVPAGGSLAEGGQIADLDGDGRPDLLVSSSARSGYFRVADDGGFDPHGYVRYAAVPSIGLSDPLLKLVDLDGDNIVDALRTGPTSQIYYNRPGEGWVLGDSRPTGSGIPPVAFDDHRIKIADMTGDGRSDIVLVTGRRISYWPNLGLGRWGDRIDMANSPVLADPASGPSDFDVRRVLVGDVDGDGCADLVHVGPAGTTVWINRNGTSFAPPVVVRGTPRLDDASDVRLVDLLGSGTSGLLWSSQAGRGGATHRFLDLTGGIKPYLLTAIDTHNGARTSIEYSSSTRYAVADTEAGKPWRTTLPFPVQVVARMTTSERFSAATLSSEMTYHEGHWDGAEREFRGFARVDRRDVSLVDGAEHTPPLETRTWFHAGPVGPAEGAWRELDSMDDHWSGDPSVLGAIDLTGLPAGAPRRTTRDAMRVLAGRILRTEVHALDGSAVADRPYAVTEHRYRVEPVLDGRVATDPAWADRPVFFVLDAAERTARWERGTDPLSTYRFTDGYDQYGRPSRTIQIAVPRHRDAWTATPGAEPFLATVTTTGYATRDDAAHYMTDRVAWRRRDELHDDGDSTVLDFVTATRDRTIARSVRELDVRHYDGEPFTGLAPGQLGDRGLLVHTEQLVFTDDLIQAVWGDAPGLAPGYLAGDWAARPAEYPPGFRASMANGAGYARHEHDDVYAAGWYVASRRVRLDTHDNPAGRGLVMVRRDSLGHDTTIAYDPYHLLPVSVMDEAGLLRTGVYDYASQHPTLVTDVNGNRTEAGYTPLGMLEWVANLGQEGRDEGDTPEQPGARYEYHLTAWDASPSAARQPASVHTIKRIEHRWAVVTAENARRADTGQPPLDAGGIEALFPDGELQRFPERFLREQQYSDGLGRMLQSRAQSEDFVLVDAGLPADVATVPTPATIAPADPDRPPVVVSGWRAYNDKGQVVTEWEAFLDNGWAYAPPATEQLEHTLARTSTTYDARGAAVRIVQADNSERRTVYGRPRSLADPSDFEPTPWEVFRYDANDNAGRTHPAASAAWSAHWNTPDDVLVDALGRAIRTTVREGAAEHISINRYDIDGNVLETVDALGRTTQRAAYDLLGRVWRRELLNAGTTRMVLDAQNGVLERHDAKGAMGLAAYDGRHRAVRLWARDRDDAQVTLREVTMFGDATESGLTRAQAGALNLLGRPYRSYDEAGLVTSGRFDLLGHLVEKTRQVLRTSTLIKGLPAGAGEWAGTALAIDWEPPPGQDLDQHAATLLEPAVHAFSARFDAAGRRTSLTCPVDAEGQRRVLTAAYARSGQMTTLEVDGTPFLERAVHDAHARPVLVLYGNGLMTRFAYDPQTSRLVRLRSETNRATGQLTWEGAGAKAVRQDQAFSYDLVGNIIGIADRGPGCGVAPTPDALDRSFSYDSLYRLTRADGREHDLPQPNPWSTAPGSQDVTAVRAYSETYGYDPVGNRMQLKHHAIGGSFTSEATLVSGQDRLLGVTSGGTTYAYAYDAAGNIVGETTSRLLEWDHADRLSTFRVQAGAKPSQYAQYRYDASGTRVLKLVRGQGGAVRLTLYLDSAFERIVLDADQPDGGSAHDTITVLDGDRRMAVLRTGAALPDDPMPTLTYEVTDHLGSVVDTLGTAGEMLSREEYTPYGELAFGSHARKRYRFTAKERDEESGFYAGGARYYSPWLARWASCDPEHGRDVGTPYTYCSNRPLQLVDKTGAAGLSVGALPLAPTTPSAPLSPTLLRGLPGEGLGDGIPRGVLRLVPETGPGAAAGTGAAEAAVLGGAILAAAGALLLLGVTLHDAMAGRETPIDVADKFYGTHFGDIAGWVKGHYSKPANVTVASSNRDDGAARQSFRAYVTSTILDGCKGAEHPLRKLLDPSGKPYPAGDRYNFQDPIFDSGHPLSIAGGGEGLGIEWPAENRYDGSKSEKKGIALEKIFVDVCGVPIEKGYLRAAEQHGLVPKGTLENAPRSGGWVPGQGLIPPVTPPPASAPMVSPTGK